MDILITGSIAFDYLMRFPGRFKDAMVEGALDKVSLSFLVDEMTRHFGGVAANIAYNVALLGGRPRLFGTVGRDFGDYRIWLEKVGVDVSTTVLVEELFTASFFANTDLENNQISSFYAGAMGKAGDYGIFDVMEHTPDLVVISPNAPDAMNRIVDECRTHNIPYLYDPSQQTPRLDGETLRNSISHASILTVNEYEWELVEQKTGLTRQSVIDNGTTLIITLGENGAHIYADDTRYEIPVIEGVSVKDPTGCGDAFRGGLLRGLQHGLSWDVTGRLGAVMAAYVLEVVGTQNHQVSLNEFIQRYRQQFQDDVEIEKLLEVEAITDET